MEVVAHSRSKVGAHRHLWIVLGVLVPSVLLAFGPTYFDGKTFSNLDVTTLTHLHAALMMLWVLMLIGQAWFIRTRRFTIHRWVGRSSYVIVPLIVLTTMLFTIETLQRKPEIVQLDYQVDVFTWGQVVPFVLAWALALIYRRKTPIHVRYMVSTIFAAGSAIVFRIIMNYFAWLPGLDISAGPASFNNIVVVNGSVLVFVLLALIAIDWRRGIKLSPFWLVTISTIVMHIGFFTFAKSSAWMEFVQWYAGLQ